MYKGFLECLAQYPPPPHSPPQHLHIAKQYAFITIPLIYFSPVTLSGKSSLIILENNAALRRERLTLNNIILLSVIFNATEVYLLLSFGGSTM